MLNTINARNQDPAGLLPLTPVVFSILMALADGEKHGYAIMQTVAAETGGSVPMGPGTLYGSLERMLRSKLVVESEGNDESSPHRERRRYYRLTDFGDRVLRAEVRRLDQSVSIARKKKLIPRHNSIFAGKDHLARVPALTTDEDRVLTRVLAFQRETKLSGGAAG